MNKPTKIYTTPGIDCNCTAKSDNECGCGADWTNYTTYNRGWDEWDKYHNYIINKLSNSAQYRRVELQQEKIRGLEEELSAKETIINAHVLGIVKKNQKIDKMSDKEFVDKSVNDCK